MKLLLDTHAFLWWHGERAKLSPKVMTLCKEISNALYLSLASMWEIQIKLTSVQDRRMAFSLKLGLSKQR